MFNTSLDSEPFAIVTNRLFDSEWELLQYAIRSGGNSIIYWSTFEGTPYLEKGQILLINGFTENSIDVLRDWMVDISIVGRLEESQLNFLSSTDTVSFWNLDKYSLKSCIAYIGARNIPLEEPRILLWTGSKKLNSILLSLYKFYGVTATNASNSEVALYTLEDKKYDILVLDWDYSGMDIYYLIRDLRKIKSLREDFPMVIGIKDFDKPNIFKDLSAGIRDFCPVLFTPEEVWNLFLRSLPFEEDRPIALLDAEAPLIKKKHPQEGGDLTLDYLKESRILKSENYASMNELDKMSFRRQFEWVKI